MPGDIPLEQAARDASSFLGEPEWLLNARLSAVALLEKRNGKAEISGFRLSKGKLHVSTRTEGEVAILTIAEALKRGNALKEQLGRPLTGKEPDDYLLALALFTGGNVIAVGGTAPASVFLEMAGGAPDYFATFFLFANDSTAAVFAKSSFAINTHEARALFLGRGATAHFCALQENGEKADTVAGMVARLGEGSSLKFLNSNIGSNEKKDGFLFLQDGRGSRCEHYEVSLARGRQKFSKSSFHFHSAPDTFSRSVFKYATAGSSQVNVDGQVTIEQNAPGSDTHLLAKSLLLSDDSMSKVVPQLYVHNADVAAGHGSALTPMPEEELFYLQSRGVGESESKLLVLQGFLQDVLVKSEIEPLVLRTLSEELEKDALRVFPRD